MVDPVVAVDGYTYEREAIQQWLQTHQRSAQTNERLDSYTLIPNKSLRSQIWSWVDAQVCKIQNNEELTNDK